MPRHAAQGSRSLHHLSTGVTVFMPGRVLLFAVTLLELLAMPAFASDLVLLHAAGSFPEQRILAAHGFSAPSDVMVGVD